MSLLLLKQENLRKYVNSKSCSMSDEYAIKLEENIINFIDGSIDNCLKEKRKRLVPEDLK